MRYAQVAHRVGAIDKTLLVWKLEKARTCLIRAYVVHVIWFALMCVFIVLRWNAHGLKASVLLTLITVPPVLFYTVRVHTLCRAIDPRAHTIGLLPVLVTTLVLSPFEAGLVLPAKNLIAANRTLRAQRTLSAASDIPEDGSNDLLNPNPPTDIGTLHTSDYHRLLKRPSDGSD